MKLFMCYLWCGGTPDIFKALFICEQEKKKEKKTGRLIHLLGIWVLWLHKCV